MKQLLVLSAVVMSVFILLGCTRNSDFEKISKLYKDAKFEQVIEVCDEKIEKNPKEAYYYACKGQALSRLEKFGDAQDAFEKAIEIDPNVGWFYREYGNVLLALHNDQEAVKQFDKSIELSKGNEGVASAYAYRSGANLSLGYDKNAIEDANEALKLDPKNVYAMDNRAQAYIYICEYDKAIKDINNALEIYSKSPRPYVTRASAYLNKGELDKAMEDAEKALSFGEENWYAQEVLSAVYFAKKEYLSAEQLTRKLIAGHPEYARGYYDLGLVLLCQGKLDEAKEEARKALEQDQKHVCSLILNGLVAALEGNAKESDEYYEKAKSMHPGCKAVIDKSETFAQIALKNYDKALYISNSYLEDIPKSSLMLRVRSEIYRRKGNNEFADADYEKAISKGYRKDSQVEDLLRLL